MSNKTFFKRIGAFMIDAIIIYLITSALLYLPFLNKHYDKYLEFSDQYNEVIDNYLNEEIEADEFMDQTRRLSYDLNKNGYVYVISNGLIALLYYGVFQYCTKGQTLGKKIFSLKVVSNNDKELNLLNHLVRCFILYGLITNIGTLIGIVFSRNVYYKINAFTSNLNTIIMIVIAFMVLFNKKGRGLHDYVAGTKVIDLKNDYVKETEVKNDEEDN